MIIDRNHILKLAELANITLAEEEIDSYISDVNRILDLVSEIQDVDTTDVEPK
jgi:aspartyl-tRNA(Asn)/glutamyl-tRNA(Gln) amidotransferase subunit C